jgi:hypothetical protein
MNTFKFNKRFYILLIIFVLVVEYFLVANIYSSKDDESSMRKNFVLKNYDKNQMNKKDFFDRLHSKLGENYVQDFLKYSCLSATRYGAVHKNLNYRVEGKYFLKYYIVKDKFKLEIFFKELILYAWMVIFYLNLILYI